MELEMIEDSDQSAHLCSLIKVLQLQSKNPKNKKTRQVMSLNNLCMLTCVVIEHG